LILAVRDAATTPMATAVTVSLLRFPAAVKLVKIALLFCSQCGAADVTGNFCWQCGAALAAGAAPPPAAAERQPGPPPASVDWSHETSYGALMRIPEVRERVSRQTTLAPHRMSGEEFLGFADKVIGPAMGMKVPMAPVAELVQPLYERMGVKTGKTRAERFQWPVGRVIVAVLCSLGRRGMTIASVHQAHDGCVIEAQIPSDWRSFAGTLLVTVSGDGDGTTVEGGTRVPGQLFDWGKSTAFLGDLFADVAELSPPDVVG
jgi:hypothetical protein